MIIRRALSPMAPGWPRWAVFTIALAAVILQSGRPTKAAAKPATSPATNHAERAVDYRAQADEVMTYIQRTYAMPNGGLYAHSVSDRRPDFMWGNGILFSAFVGAARHDPQTYGPRLSEFFQSMDKYWDRFDVPPGYEPAPTHARGNDKYYDDNAWMVLSLTEAYELTHDHRYLQRARQTLDFVLSGWDEKGGGGIWWHEMHKEGTKNTCANAPAAVACLRVAKFLPPDDAEKYRAMAQKIVHWTQTNFDDRGLYSDSIVVDSGEVHRGKLTYNTALMIRAFLALYRATNDANDLSFARRSSEGANWFVDRRTNAFRDPAKWSHLLVEADLEMYRTTQDENLLRRATSNAAFEYQSWKKNKPDELIENASIARTLWLMADTQTNVGQRFWTRMDRP